MSAPSLFRPVDGRRVSVVRDADAVSRVLADDPVGACMVAARVADHGVDPRAIGGELWTRGRAEHSLCYAGANMIPLRGDSADLRAFADQALGTARRCSSLVGPVDLVLGMWERLQHGWGPAGLGDLGLRRAFHGGLQSDSDPSPGPRAGPLAT